MTVPVSGTPDDVVRGLSEVIDAGAQMLLLNPVGPDVAENREQMERLAAEVIPRLLSLGMRDNLRHRTACGGDLLACAATELVRGQVDLDGELAVAKDLDQRVRRTAPWPPIRPHRPHRPPGKTG